MSYSHIGAPTEFNGSRPNGGDSGKLQAPFSCHECFILNESGTMIVMVMSLILGPLPTSQRKSQSMVREGRFGLHHHRLGDGVGHDSRTGFPLFGSGPKKVGLEHDLCLHGFLLHHHLPMVLLGLFVSLQRYRHERIHWRSETLWSYEYPGGA